MSQFSQFFGADGGGNSTIAGGSIYSGIAAPRIWGYGNTSNYNSGNQIAENFPLIGSTNILGVNVVDDELAVATWQNALVWAYNETDSGKGAIGGFVYNHIEKALYIGKIVSTTAPYTATVFRLDLATGAQTQIGSAGAAPRFLAQSPVLGSTSSPKAWVDESGWYECIDTVASSPTYRQIMRYSPAFALTQYRVLNPAITPDNNPWYYTQDTGTRCRIVNQYTTTGSSSATISPARPRIIIERIGSRRVINVTTQEVYSSNWRDDLTSGYSNSIASMAPGETPGPNTRDNGMYYGGAVRLCSLPRAAPNTSDTFLLDRTDYDRWLNEVADKLGMPRTNNFYGDWINV